MFTLFAHGGEAHTSTVDANLHYLQDGYVAIPLLFLIVSAFAVFFYIVTRKSKALTYLFVVALLFVIGITSYSTSAPMSITALAVGMAMILVSVLLSLMKPAKPSVKKSTKNSSR
jgi:predicted membrane protein